MGCLSPELLKQYPNPHICIFGSTVDPTSGLVASFVTDADTGYVVELEKTGQHATGPGSAVFVENPYTTMLRPNSDLNDLYLRKGQDMLIESVLFFAVDATKVTPTLMQPVAATEYQDPVVVADMITSQSTVMDANYASHFRNSMIGNWQPNWFRPSLFVNGRNILANISKSQFAGTGGSKNHRADMSIGLALPFSLDLALEIKGGITSIEAHGQVVQYIAQTAQARKYVRYPVFCYVVVRHK
jgi:hypothetical protein